MEQAELTQAERNILQALAGHFGEAVTGHEKFDDQLSIFVDNTVLFELARFMKDEEAAGFELLSDICGVDWIDNPQQRFELIYNFYSVNTNERVLIRTFLPDSEKPSIRSIQPIYPGADWLEREVYDMLGIEFEGHPDLRRIITPDDFEGWPHRKDYPLTYEAPNFSYNKDKPPEIIK